MKLNFSRFGVEATVEAIDLEFEVQCPVCSLGRMPDSGAKCSTCDGTGLVLTGLGQYVLEFVLRAGPRYRASKEHAAFLRRQEQAKRNRADVERWKQERQRRRDEAMKNVTVESGVPNAV